MLSVNNLVDIARSNGMKIEYVGKTKGGYVNCKTPVGIIRKEIYDLELIIENVDFARMDFSIVSSVGDIDITDKENVLAICNIALGYKKRQLNNLLKNMMRDSVALERWGENEK